MAKSKEYQFFSEQFWDLMKKQGKKCALSGIELVPQDVEVELVNPKETDMAKRKAIKNHYLVCRDVSYLSRHLSKNEIIKLCKDILKYQGYKVVKAGKK